MSLDEHTLIQKYFSDVGSAFLAEKGVRVSVGDDAAIINNTPDIFMQLLLTYYLILLNNQ